MKHYFQITVIANPYQQEELIALFSDLNVCGFEEKEETLMIFFNEENFDEVQVQQLVQGYDYKIEKLAEKNWNEEWEKSFTPVNVDGFCGIRAAFHPPFSSVLHDIVITPKMSFGTGHHATTYQMMLQMRDLDFSGKKVFDFGTGTGILAILASKLGASHVVAIDVDAWSIENATENISQNACSNIELRHGSVLPEGEFDIVLANINRNVILQHAEALKKALVKEGKLLLSGLLKEDETLIRQAFEPAFALIRKTEKDNWISLLMSKKNEMLYPV